MLKPRRADLRSPILCDNNDKQNGKFRALTSVSSFDSNLGFLSSVILVKVLPSTILTKNNMGYTIHNILNKLSLVGTKNKILLLCQVSKNYHI